MLQEILLSLSGVPSPIWEKLRQNDEQGESLRDYISQPEQAMLARLSHISQLHIEVKDYSNLISSRHPSLICRAISSSISNKHLAAFRERILEVESSILKGDATHVGAYQIVPLSTLVADFAPWTRRLEWLKKLTHFMKGARTKNSLSDCTAARVLGFLEDERHTGYADIEHLATQLLVVGQNTWMRSISAWILYSQLPTPGSDDFMIRAASHEGMHEQGVLQKELVPGFVSQRTAQDVLDIGNALRQLKSPHNAVRSGASQSTAAALLGPHLSKIKLLEYPLNSSLLESTMSSINESISQHALSSLLPPSKVIEICKVLQDYILLNRGEFALTLIENSDTRVLSRQKLQSSSARPVRKLGRIDDLVLQSTEFDSILSKTWSDLIALQGQSETEDDIFESARQYLRLKALQDQGEKGQTACLSTMLPTPASLQLEFSPTSPLNIFLSRPEKHAYSKISSYLLSLRRSQMRLSNLWKLSNFRRCHPTPLAPPMSATEYGRRACKARRDREERRAKETRRFWSSMNKSLFLLNEYESYLHGEVIQNSWKHFESWIKMDDRPVSSSREILETSSSSSNSLKRSFRAGSRSKDDPRTLARAHSTYLAALSSALLLNNNDLITSLKSFLDLLDHFIALFDRLASVWQGLDLQEDDGVLDAFTNFAQDEKDIMTEMNRARLELEVLLEQLVGNLKDIEKANDTNGLPGAFAGVGIDDSSKVEFVPWRARTLDRLIMKLDFLYRKDDGSERLVEGSDYE